MASTSAAEGPDFTFSACSPAPGVNLKHSQAHKGSYMLVDADLLLQPFNHCSSNQSVVSFVSYHLF